jgi:hypothetical protein
LISRCRFHNEIFISTARRGVAGEDLIRFR